MTLIGLKKRKNLYVRMQAVYILMSNILDMMIILTGSLIIPKFSRIK